MLKSFDELLNRSSPKCTASSGADCAQMTAAVTEKLQRLLDGTDVPFAYHYRGAAADARWAVKDPESRGVHNNNNNNNNNNNKKKLTTLNRDWELCESLPAALCVPRFENQDTLRGSASFRSMSSIPSFLRSYELCILGGYGVVR